MHATKVFCSVNDHFPQVRDEKALGVKKIYIKETLQGMASTLPVWAKGNVTS